MGLTVGLFFAVQQTATGVTLYGAVLKGIGVATAVMVLAAFSQRLYAGDKLQSAQLPGGAGGTFETAEAAKKTRESVEELNDRLTTLTEQMIEMQAQLDKRVSGLEAAQPKGRNP
ncbi:MAG: hypothetical protein M3Z27_01845 [Actinomycetota bacterium]|nr:hypothetical protein [Actinomycetota bacterium]